MKTVRIPFKLRYIFAVIAMFLLPHAANATSPLEADPTISSGVDSKFYFATGANAGKPGGIVGVMLDGKIVFQRAYGMADVANNVTNSTSAPFYLASVSKQFTAMGILLCQEKGLLTLNDELRLHIPELDPVFNGVKIKHLLNMISAIQDVGTGVQSKTAGEMLSRLLEEGPYGIVATELPVGSTMKYTNMNYVLLSIIVERVSGKTFSQFAQEEIFSKLGMNETVIHDDVAQVVADQPNGYEADLTLWSTAATTSPATGSTGVISTISDLAKWHQNFYANQLGNKDQNLITLMETPGRYTSGTKTGQPVSDSVTGLPSYACGLMPDSIWNASGYIKRVWHTGRWLGFKTGTYRYPDLNMSVFVLLNRDDIFPPAQAVADLFIANVRFATGPPPDTAEVGTPYSFKYSATGWPRPAYTLESGSLPNGITLNSDGTLIGTPTVTGYFNGVVKATSGAKTKSQNFTIHVVHPAAYSLSVTITGSGGGTITTTSPGTIAADVFCSSGTCSTFIPLNSLVELTYTADNISTFDVWGGNCSGNQVCSFHMDGPRAVFASFSQAPKTRITDTGYSSLSDAYKAAATSGDIIMAIDSEMPDKGLNVNEEFSGGKSITIKGGYYADYGKGRSGFPTTLKGPLYISSGTLVVEGLSVH